MKKKKIYLVTFVKQTLYDVFIEAATEDEALKKFVDHDYSHEEQERELIDEELRSVVCMNLVDE